MVVKSFKRTIALCIASLVFLGIFLMCGAPVKTDAASVQDQINQLNQQIAQLEKQIANDKKDLAAQKSVKSGIDAKISAMQKKINLCNQLITDTRNAIAQSEKNIEQKNNEIAETKELFRKRICAIYMSNSNSSLQILLGAESFSDLLTRSEFTKCLAAQDTAMIKELSAAIIEINKEIELNKQRKAELDKNLAELEADKAELDNDIAEVNAVISKINNGISTSQKDLNNLNSYMNSLLYGGEIDAAFDGRFIWPVPGNYNVTCEFDSHDPLHPTGHMGMDISASRGTRIVAAATGQVTQYSNDCNHDYGKTYSCGCGNGFGNHVRISHGWYNGSHFLTVYGHMRNVADGIRKGVHVNRGQVIGYIGSTGFSTAPHLHFAVAKKSSSSTTIYKSNYVNPRNYLS